MKRTILILVFILFLIPNLIFASPLVGYEYSDTDSIPCNYNRLWACAPEAAGYYWKAVRSLAVNPGFADQFELSIASTPSTSAEVGWAVYEDNGMVGDLKAGGYFPSIQLSVGENIFPATIINNNVIEAGKYYWYTWHSSLGDQVQIQRGRSAGTCPPDMRKFTNYNGWYLFSPPPGNKFINSLAPGCYAWGIEEE